MITDLTIEILALKCNSQDLFTAKLVASKNQMISGDKKHTTIMGKTRTTNKRRERIKIDIFFYNRKIQSIEFWI